MAKRADVERFCDKTDPRGKQDNAIMAGMLKSLDDSVGRVLAVLTETGQADNTIIVFASDNGGNEYSLVEGKLATNNDPLRSGKGNLYEGGVRTPAIVVWPGVVQPGGRSEGLVTSTDWYPTLLEAAGLEPVPAQHVDGVSIVPALKGGASPPRAGVLSFSPLRSGHGQPPGLVSARGPLEVLPV
jgi:arylsulfatase A-like enzyme